ncbi:hypothetical protein HDU96_007722 [Phlyctochytrium bullatum]|nr:hypothetical protein HDU96_007722 [Phlyctochytrium bullatum]
MPEMLDDKDTPKDSLNIAYGSGSASKKAGDFGIWDDEESRSFYENLIDLKDFVPHVLLGEKSASETVVEFSANEAALEEEQLEVSEQPTIELSEESDKGASTESQPAENAAARLTAVIAKLLSSLNRAVVDEVAVEFAYLNSKLARRKFKVVPIHIPLYMVKTLIDDLNGTNIDLCNPPEASAKPEKPRSPLEQYLRKLLYLELSKRSAEKVLKQLRKLNWEDAGAVFGHGIAGGYDDAVTRFFDLIEVYKGVAAAGNAEEDLSEEEDDEGQNGAPGLLDSLRDGESESDEAGYEQEIMRDDGDGHSDAILKRQKTNVVDEDFEKEFGQVMVESLESRRNERKAGAFDVAIPGRGRIESAEIGDDIIFGLLTKRGNKQQVKPIALPKTSSFAESTRIKREAELEEKQQLKRLVLSYEEREREEKEREISGYRVQRR